MNFATACHSVGTLTLFKSFFFFFLFNIFQGALNQFHVIQIALYRGRTVYINLYVGVCVCPASGLVIYDICLGFLICYSRNVICNLSMPEYLI